MNRRLLDAWLVSTLPMLMPMQRTMGPDTYDTTMSEVWCFEFKITGSKSKVLLLLEVIIIHLDLNFTGCAWILNLNSDFFVFIFSWRFQF